jgi:all-trans-retinol 13,14-reductase
MLETRKPQVYRPERAEGRYDAVVIGSGMGGLSAAALLSRAGRRVLVLERHYVMGGFTHTFRRKRYEWDVGVHYVGEFHTSGTLPNLLLADISDGSLSWAPMPANYDRIIFPDREYDIWGGRERFVDGLVGDFPSERATLHRYLELIDEVNAAGMRFFQYKALPPFIAPAARPFLCRKFLAFSDQTTLTALGRLTSDRKLVGVLTGQWGTYGLPPGESSFGIHAIVVNHYMEGAAYPVGGAGRIAASILSTIERGGGTLLVAAEVSEVLIRNGRAVGVRMEDGHEILAPVVVSDAGVVNTFGSLVDESTRRRLGLEAKLAELEPSASHVCLYVGLAETAESLGLEATNRWIYPGYDHDENVRAFEEDSDAPLPSVYISFPSAKDPSWEARRGSTATLEVISFVPYEWFEPWEGERWKKRGASYDELKARYTERLLEALYEHVPEVKGKVDYHELSTPLSTRHFANYGRGEIYGAAATPERFRVAWLGPRTPIGGLFLTGQDAVAHGVTGALYAGLVSASAVLGRDVLRDVRRRVG